MNIICTGLVEHTGYRKTTVGNELVEVYQVEFRDDNNVPLLTNSAFLKAAADFDLIPQPGAYSTIDQTIQVESVYVEPQGMIAIVVVTYKLLAGFQLNVDDNGPCQLEIEVGTAEYQTQLDKYGNQITIKFISPTKTDSTTGGPLTVTQPGSVSVQKPVITFRYTRRENRNPAEQALKYGGTVNNARWNGGDTHTWLCQIRAVQDPGGQAYTVTREFHYLKDTWDPVVVATDPDTGQYMVAPTWGVSIKEVEVQDEADFSALNLHEAVL